MLFSINKFKGKLKSKFYYWNDFLKPKSKKLALKATIISTNKFKGKLMPKFYLSDHSKTRIFSPKSKNVGSKNYFYFQKINLKVN